MIVRCHPDNKEELLRALQTVTMPSSKPIGIKGMRFEIVTDDAMPKTKGTGRFIKKGDWEIEDQFVHWGFDKDGYIVDPPSWMVSLGMVEEEQELYYVVTDESYISARYGNWPMLMTDQRRSILTGITS